jgi:hypothetical protein
MATRTDHRTTDVWRRIATVALITAGVLILTSVFFPSPDDPADYDGFLALLVDNMGRTQAVMLAVPVGIWAFAVGTTALYHSIEGKRASTGVRVGSLGTLIGAAAVTVQFGLAGAALAETAGSGAEAGVALWAGATYIRSFGMLVLWTGVAIIGLGMLTGRAYPRTLGWPPIILGIAMVMVSGAAIIAGPTKAASLASGGLAGLTAIWSMVLGAWLGRQQFS